MPISSQDTGSPIKCQTSSRQSRRAIFSDAKLTGANPIDVLIEFPKGASLYAPETLAVICSGPFPPRATSRRRQCLVARDIAALAHQGRGTRRWHLERICRHTAEIFDGRFISATQDAVVVSGRIPDADASRLLPIIGLIDNVARGGSRAATPATAYR